MIAKNSITESGVCSISETLKILLLEFWFLYFQFFFFRDFLDPLALAHFSFEIFFSFASLFPHNF